MKGYINVTLIGALGRDPEIRATQSGKKIASFSVAVDQGFGESAKTEWVNVVSFGTQAEFAEKYLKKGKPVAISGTLQTQSWEDKTSGQKRYKTEVIARDIQFMDGGESRTTQPARRETPAPERRQADPFEEEIF